MSRRQIDRARSRRNLARFALLISFVWLVSTVWWLVTTSLGAVQFRDHLIDQEYEGSLSTNLGLLVAFTSEAASQIDASWNSADQQAADEIKGRLSALRRHLSGLRSPRVHLAGHAFGQLDEVNDEAALLRLIGDPALQTLPLGALGLAAKPSEGLPGYPHFESADSQTPASSFVFISASHVGLDGHSVALSAQQRRELVFSKIAERGLHEILGRPHAFRISQAYYIGCSDFIRVVPPSPQPISGYRKAFRPLRSFADRTYFHATMGSADRVRESALYLDTTGGGFVRTYSAFVTNAELGLCGMVAVDVTLRQLEDLWHGVGLGGASRLRDFKFGTYSLRTHDLQIGSIERRSRRELKRILADNGDLLAGGVQRWPAAGATLFTVPMGAEKVGIVIFDASLAQVKYFAMWALGALAIMVFGVLVGFAERSSRAVEETEKQRTEILNKLHSGFVMVNKHGYITYANEPFRKMVKAMRTGASVEAFLAEESAADYRKRMASGAAEFEFPGSVVSARGLPEPVIIASSLLSDSKPGSRMLIFIPSRDLEQQIARKFLNVFSHALKSPVHSILLITDLFRRRKAHARFDEFFGLLLRKVQEFRVLTDNVLRFSALSVKDIQVSWEPVNVARVLRNALSAGRERAKAVGLELTESVPDRMRTRADPELLRIVFNNLIDNALKYTQRGQIRVCAMDRMPMLRIEVDDTGPGVPEADRERIFSLFTQGAGAPAASHEGLGLGLFISRLYVEAMGGKLRYEPIYGEGAVHDDASMVGSRFIVELPKQGGFDEKEQQDEGAPAGG